jgi:tetratricopeptide (TPR) repeat protein
LKAAKDLPGAVAAFKKALAIDDQYAMAWANLGIALTDSKDVPGAIAAFKKAIALDGGYTQAQNALAWQLATCSDARLRNPSLAVALAKKAVDLAPKNPNYPNTLGVAHYRTGDWKAAIAALEKSMKLRQGGDSFDWFVVAMAHWRLGEKDKAREWYDRAVRWMDKNQPRNEELRRFRAEAGELLELQDKK